MKSAENLFSQNRRMTTLNKQWNLNYTAKQWRIQHGKSTNKKSDKHTHINYRVINAFEADE